MEDARTMDDDKCIGHYHVYKIDTFLSQLIWASSMFKNSFFLLSSEVS
jgi:hypothetical protein